jgi:rhodanese-related sulfurtransferase
MTISWLNSLIFLTALGLISCADPVREVSALVLPAGKKTPAGKRASPNKSKVPRMNGRGEITSISLEKLFALQQSGSALIYDARPSFYYSMGHIPGALNLPKANSDAQIIERKAEIESALAAKKTIVVYCTNLTCPDARTVAIHLASFGYSSSTLTGGWDSWKESGLPTE